MWCWVRIRARLYFGFSHTTSQFPGWGSCRGSHSLGCCLPPGPCCVTLSKVWVAKEGQAPHSVPATKTGWKTQETWAGVLPLHRGAVLLLNPVSLSCCNSWSWNTFQQGVGPCPQLRARQEEERKQLHHGTAKGQGSMGHPDVGLATSSS